MVPIRHFALTIVLLAAAAIPCGAQDAHLRASALSAGAETSHGDGIILQSTIGQPIVGRADGTSHVASAGFWYQARTTAGVVEVNNPPDEPEIIHPNDGSQILVGGDVEGSPADPSATIAIRWTGGTDPDGDDVAYSWQIATDSDYANLLLSLEVDSTGKFEVSLALLAGLLDGAGIDLGGSISLFHRIVATDGQLTTPGPNVTITLIRGTLVSTEDVPPDVPGSYELHQNYPNPFNPTTTIGYDLPETAWVRLTVYDVFGREVSRLVDESQATGRYAVPFEATGLASGLYLYRIEAGAFQRVRQMLLVK